MEVPQPEVATWLPRIGPTKLAKEKAASEMPCMVPCHLQLSRPRLPWAPKRAPARVSADDSCKESARVCVGVALVPRQAPRAKTEVLCQINPFRPALGAELAMAARSP